MRPPAEHPPDAPRARRLRLAATLLAFALTAVALGVAGGDRIRLGPLDVALEAAREAYEGGLERALAGELAGV